MRCQTADKHQKRAGSIMPVGVTGKSEEKRASWRSAVWTEGRKEIGERQNREKEMPRCICSDLTGSCPCGRIGY